MARFIAPLLAFLAPLLAFAQKAGEDAPVEHASSLTVVIFLALFFGSILAYVVYLWWRTKGSRQSGDE